MTYKGLPADYDAWKTRSDHDDQPEDTMQEIAKEIETALNHDLKSDFPNAKGLGLKPAPATARDRLQTTIQELENLVADLKTSIATLATIRGKL